MPKSRRSRRLRHRSDDGGAVDPELLDVCAAFERNGLHDAPLFRHSINQAATIIADRDVLAVPLNAAHLIERLAKLEYLERLAAFRQLDQNRVPVAVPCVCEKVSGIVVTAKPRSVDLRFVLINNRLSFRLTVDRNRAVEIRGELRDRECALRKRSEGRETRRFGARRNRKRSTASQAPMPK